MKKLACYIILFFAVGGFASEICHDFMDFKLIYYHLYPEKYFEKDKLYIYKKEENNSSSSSGLNSTYCGILENSKTKANIYYNTLVLKNNTMVDNEGFYLKVWYCENVKKTSLRTSNKITHDIYTKGVITYILILMIIPCLIYVLKKDKNED